MDEILFTSAKEEKIFSNALAHRRIKKLEAENEKLTSEIAELKFACDALYKKYDPTFNYFEEMIKSSDNVYSINPYQERPNSHEEFAKKVSEIKSKMLLDEKEDADYAESRVKTREQMVADNLNIIHQIEVAYPDARSFDVKEAFDVFPLSEVQKFISPAPVVENKEEIETQELEVNPIFESQEPVIPAPLGKKIISINPAPPRLLAMIGTPVEKVPEESNDAILTESSFFSGSDDEFAKQILGESTEKKPVLNEVPESDVTTSSLDGSKDFVYKMRNGDSLANLALTICGDENGWTDIYRANQELIENRIKERQYVDIDKVQYDKDLLTDLSLSIPTIYKKSASLTLAA